MNNENLTAAQRAAIESEAKTILCVASPGSGKTSVLVARIRHIIESGVEPSKIVAITYTNAAAKEIMERIGGFYQDLEPPGPRICNVDLGFAGTLHGFALRMLRQHGGALGYGARAAVVDEDAALDLLDAARRRLKCKTSLDKLAEMKRGGRPACFEGEFRRRLSVEATVLCAYFDELKEAGLLDFDLILTEFLELLQHSSMGDDGLFAGLFTHVFVDEVQDSAEIDWRIYHYFWSENKFLVGDPDQAIYGFRGGRVDLMTAFAREPETTILYLSDNFRCEKNICMAANNLIAHNALRIPKATLAASPLYGSVERLRPAKNEGEEIAMVAQAIMAEGETHPDGSIAVLARTNAIAAGFREGLKAAGIPVVEPPKSEMPRDWGKARALVELMAAPNNDLLARTAMKMIFDVARADAALRKAHTKAVP